MIKKGQQQPLKQHLPIATQQQIHHLDLPSAKAPIYAAFIYGRIPPEAESTEGNQF